MWIIAVLSSLHVRISCTTDFPMLMDSLALMNSHSALEPCLLWPQLAYGDEITGTSSCGCYQLIWHHNNTHPLQSVIGWEEIGKQLGHCMP